VKKTEAKCGGFYSRPTPPYDSFRGPRAANIPLPQTLNSTISNQGCGARVPELGILQRAITQLKIQMEPDVELIIEPDVEPI